MYIFLEEAARLPDPALWSAHQGKYPSFSSRQKTKGPFSRENKKRVGKTY